MLDLINQIYVSVYYIDFGMYLSNTYKNAMAFSYVDSYILCRISKIKFAQPVFTSIQKLLIS